MYCFSLIFAIRRLEMSSATNDWTAGFAQGRHRLHVAVGVGELGVDEERDDREWREDRAEHDQDRRQDVVTRRVPDPSCGMRRLGARRLDVTLPQLTTR